MEAKQTMEIVCIKAQMIRKATEESQQKEVQYNSPGGNRCKTKVPKIRRASIRKFPFSLGPAFLHITWKPKPAQKFQLEHRSLGIKWEFT